MNTRHSATAAAVASSSGVERRKPGLLERFTDHFQRYWQLWVLSAPALVFVAIFAYVPMWGIHLAFRKFDSARGLTGGEWVGLHYFEQFFTSPLFGEILWNTFRISLWTLVTGFIFPIILALLINQTSSTASVGVSDAQRAADQMKVGIIIVSTLPLLVLYPFLQKYFNKGVMLGAVKGCAPRRGVPYPRRAGPCRRPFPNAMCRTAARIPIIGNTTQYRKVVHHAWSVLRRI